jgi:hypothetical protein
MTPPESEDEKNDEGASDDRANQPLKKPRNYFHPRPLPTPAPIVQKNQINSS